MDNLYEMIKKADDGDAEAQWRVAWHIVWEKENEPIEPDWLERALDYFEQSAMQGYGDAMLDLGAMYSVGRGIPRDIDKAFYWFNQAAVILHPKAFRCLGYALEIPLGYRDPHYAGDKQDYKTAFGYFFKGAMLNEQNSIYKIGDMYFTGKYVGIDKNFAFKLYKESYNRIDYIEDDSYASVCLRLGECFCEGIGTKQDLGEACKYLKRAIEGFEIRVKRGDNPQYYMEGYNRAKHLIKRIEAGKIPAQPIVINSSGANNEYTEFITGEMMEYPEPLYPIAELDSLKTENPKIGYSIENGLFNDLLDAAEAGDKKSMYHIAFYCFNRFKNTQGSKDVIDFALYYYHKAIRHGNKYAMFDLGSIYYNGDGGVSVDNKKAYLLYLYSDLGIAQGELGVFYAKGEIVEKNYEKAFLCFAKCALLKINWSYGSLANLARMHREGIYVSVDEKFADHLEELSKKAELEINEAEGE